jgi:chemotaxis protein methyltransferase CheR
MLETRWLPSVIAENPPQIGIWSAGCACGEEVYTLKIVWEHLKADTESLPPLHIFATDRNPRYLERARLGRYHRSSLREVSADERAAFFEVCKGARDFVIKTDYTGDITWEIHDVLNEPPARRFGIIFLRNSILTYCRQELQAKALVRILECLEHRGLLILGCHEYLPLKTNELVAMDECPYVYRKN